MLRYERYGQGPLLVLAHGSPGNARSWKAVGERLAGRFDIVALNLPGYEGATPPDPVPPTETASIAAEVEMLIASLDAPVTLAAHSFGGNVALRIAMRQQVPLERLVLFEPVVVNILPIAGKHEDYRALKDVFDGYIVQSARGEPFAVRTMVDFWFGAGAFDAMPEPVQAYLRLWSAKNVAEVQAGFRETFTQEELAGVTIPVDVACGTRSPEVTAEMARTVAGFVASGRYHSLDGTDHNILATHPDVVAALIDEAAQA